MPNQTSLAAFCVVSQQKGEDREKGMGAQMQIMVLLSLCTYFCAFKKTEEKEN